MSASGTSQRSGAGRPGSNGIAAADQSVSAAVDALRRRQPGADPLSLLPDVHPGRLPRHVAIIMDGNGRWANERGFPREFGHRNGAASVRAAVETAGILGIECLTLYSFSMENWRRPPAEVDALMDLCVAYLNGEEAELRRRGIRLRIIGRREGLPPAVLDAIDRVTAATAACTRGTLCLAINYGSRAEITDAARAIARRVAAGELLAERVDESTLAAHLSTADLPEPDLLIRTSGELRLSNFLLWQLSYAEIYVSPVHWPDFGPAEFLAAVRAYASRRRRYGGVDEARADA